MPSGLDLAPRARFEDACDAETEGKPEMSHAMLEKFVEGAADRHGIPGLAVGVWVDGREVFAGHGVTSVENPLPVNEDTLFLLGSVTKTYTATVIMRLAAEGKIDLDAPVTAYVPEFGRSDITIKHLVNHTSGLDWGVMEDTGENDDALARYVDYFAALPPIAQPGERTSYSQGGYNLLGRVIEKVTGMTFERAVAELLLQPLGLQRSFFSREDVMTRRFAVGHDLGQGGTLTVSRPWRHWRGDAPGGGIATSIGDLLRWARFHLGEERAEVVSAEVRSTMRVQTAVLRASSMGDGVGLGWFLRERDGVLLAGHGGSANGQFAELLVVPERNFAVAVASNAGPNGIPCNQEIVRWALEHFIGVIDKDPEPEPFDHDKAAQIIGNYANDAMTLQIRAEGARLVLEAKIKPELREMAEVELPQDHEPFEFGLLPGDEYVITSGAFVGQRGFFSRDPHGIVVGVDLGGRLFGRV
ncbi:serine hydrolase domain-containing protein [Nonomuraea sp. NPDC004580]|uniref:serine hydrolase domain-containing protein n=1 Tax=Nonomuraea sp. NPDC004580 TaxID=3154552 RepID=UPI0033B83748